MWRRSVETRRPPRRSTAVPPKRYRTSGSKRKEVIRMLRKLLTIGALVVVAAAFGVAPASAKSPSPGNPSNPGHHYGQDGFSDGRL
jgi:hypothetical protein